MNTVMSGCFQLVLLAGLLLAAGITAEPPSLVQSQSITGSDTSAVPAPRQPQFVSGLAAIRALGVNDLATVARRNRLKETQLKSLLLRDQDLRVNVANKKLMYACSMGGKNLSEAGRSHVHAGASSSSVSVAGAVQVMANGQLPSDADPPPEMWNKLHSRPGSTKTFYLDFTGCQVGSSSHSTNVLSMLGKQAIQVALLTTSMCG
jgi:hypothetical protein